MKTNQLKYESPAVDVLEIAVEQGFATSGTLEDIEEIIPPVEW